MLWATTNGCGTRTPRWFRASKIKNAASSKRGGFCSAILTASSLLPEVDFQVLPDRPDWPESPYGFGCCANGCNEHVGWAQRCARSFPQPPPASNTWLEGGEVVKGGWA